MEAVAFADRASGGGEDGACNARREKLWHLLAASRRCSSATDSRFYLLRGRRHFTSRLYDGQAQK